MYCPWWARWLRGQLARRLLEYSPVVLWQNLKPVFTFFYIDTDSNKCIFSPCNGWERLWLVFVCPPTCVREQGVRLMSTAMKASERKSLFLFLNSLLMCLFLLTAWWRLRCLAEPPQERNSNDSRLDCGCVCVCCACPDLVHIHAQASQCAHINQEMRRCVFRASQITPRFDRPWNAWAHLICSWILFYVFKATRPSDYPSDWKPCEMSDLITPSLSAVKTQTEQEYCKVSMRKKNNFQ